MPVYLSINDLRSDLAPFSGPPRASRAVPQGYGSSLRALYQRTASLNPRRILDRTRLVQWHPLFLFGNPACRVEAFRASGLHRSDVPIHPSKCVLESVRPQCVANQHLVVEGLPGSEIDRFFAFREWHRPCDAPSRTYRPTSRVARTRRGRSLTARSNRGIAAS